ncbi:MAG: hypothetical protein RIC04_15195 [Parvibaculum sp.]|uniref:DUF6600 domain-containing protein n=1 Tax=Parvibaculum sp. TaxID=2024848 RepID=UPI0032EDFA57
MYALPPRRTQPRTAMTLALLAALALWMSTATPAKAGYYPPAHSDAAYYYDSLAPYGTWAHHASYGAVWYPHGMAHDWRPYTHGRWVWDDGYGWTWASGFAWGWAPFHYGNWMWDAAFGWIWVPGRVWAPAWVTWRYSDSYIGWAPIGFGVNYWSYNPGWNHGGWSYVYRHHFGAPVIHHHVIVVKQYRTIYHNTRHWAPPRNAHHRVVHRGFDRGFVERGSRYKIDRVHARPEHWQRNDHRAGTPHRNDWRDDRQAARHDGVRRAEENPHWQGSQRNGRPEDGWRTTQPQERQQHDRQQHWQHQQQRAQQEQRQHQTRERQRPPIQQDQPPQRQRQAERQQPSWQPPAQHRQRQVDAPQWRAQQQPQQRQMQQQQRQHPPMQQGQPPQRQRQAERQQPSWQPPAQHRQQQVDAPQRRAQQQQQRQMQQQQRQRPQQAQQHRPSPQTRQQRPPQRHEQRAERRESERNWR